MLRELKIENLAIIDELDIEFDNESRGMGDELG